jgi:hypothetical protein
VKTLLLIVIALFGTLTVNAQCIDTPADPCIPVNQSVVNRAAQAATELLAAREAIKQLEAERAISANVAAAGKTAIDSLLLAIQTGKDIQAMQAQAIEVLKGALKTAFELIEHQQKQLMKGKSGWAKFVDVMKTVVTLAAGVTLGRGL